MLHFGVHYFTWTLIWCYYPTTKIRTRRDRGQVGKIPRQDWNTYSCVWKRLTMFAVYTSVHRTDEPVKVCVIQRLWDCWSLQKPVHCTWWFILVGRKLWAHLHSCVIKLQVQLGVLPSNCSELFHADFVLAEQFMFLFCLEASCWSQFSRVTAAINDSHRSGKQRHIYPSGAY